MWNLIGAHYGWVKNVKSLDTTVSYWQCENNRRYFNGLLGFFAFKQQLINKVISMIVNYYYLHFKKKAWPKMVWKSPHVVYRNKGPDIAMFGMTVLKKSICTGVWKKIIFERSTRHNENKTALAINVVVNLYQLLMFRNNSIWNKDTKIFCPLRIYYLVFQYFYDKKK